MANKIPFYRQLDQMDCGPTCLKMILAHYGKAISLEYLREACATSREGVNVSSLIDAAESLGFKSDAIQCDFNTLETLVPLPCIVHWEQRHFVVVYKIDKHRVFIADPAIGLLKLSKEKFKDSWLSRSLDKNNQEGYLVVLEPDRTFYEIDDTFHQDDQEENFAFLIPYLKRHKKLIIQLFIGLIIGTIIQIFSPFLTRAIVDVGISQKNLEFINLVLLGQLVLFCAQTFTNALRAWLLLHMTARINISLITDFLKKITKLPPVFFESKNMGDLLQRITDNERLQNFLSSSTLNIFFSILSVIVFSSILWIFSTAVFGILLICSIFYFAWIAIFMRKRAKVDHLRFEQAAINQTTTIQFINGMQEIKLNNSERRRRGDWELIQLKLFKLSLKSLSLSQLQDIGGGFILQLMNILITFSAAKSVVGGEFSLGTMLSIQFIVGQLNSPLSSFTGFSQSYQDAKISLKRIVEIHNKKNEVQSDAQHAYSSNPDKQDIQFQNVHFQYGSQSSEYILDNISLCIPQAKVTAIVGPSGSGKTTLLKMILKFYPPSKGTIEVGGVDLKNLNANLWRKEVAVVMQEGFIFSDTILRNITESEPNKPVDEEKLANAARIANIEEFISNLPNGYQTRIGLSGINISGGQKQRILIARAIYKNAPILLFDEATSSLDAINEATIMKNLENYYKSKTVVVVAHRLSTVKNADQILVLNKGRIVELGTHQELIDKKGFYFNLIRNQLELGS